MTLSNSKKAWLGIAEILKCHAMNPVTVEQSLLGTRCLGLARTLAVWIAVMFVAFGWPASARADISPQQLQLFESKVRPLLIDRCYECHGTKQQSGGLRLDSRAGWQKGGDSGQVLIPGRPEQSRLIEAVRRRHPDGATTSKVTLTEREIEILIEWVQMSAPDPRDDVAATSLPAQTPTDRKKHWAFEPVARPDPPRVRNSSWPLGSIDRFLMSTLEANQLFPAPDTDPYTWLRRVTLDLTGLPPTPQEVLAFVSDNSPRAQEKVVDRLLASVAFGERWARHWLDLVGYADQLGTVNDVPAPHAWRYRDYVIRAFNSDKPFDQFIREQVAGDLLPAESAEQRQDAIIATGFLLLGEIHIVTADKLQLRADIVDHQIQKVGTAFLGLTLGCVRCHDHKFDPIKLRDYYGMAGIFASSESSYVTERGVWSSIRTSELPEAPWQRAEREEALREHQETLAKAKTERAQWTNQLAEVNRKLTNAVSSAEAGNPVATKDGSENELKAKKAELEKKLSSLETTLWHLDYIEPKATVAYSVRDADQPADGRITIRGNVHAPGETVPRGFIGVLSQAPWPKIPSGTSGRSQLADWLVRTDNPLPARVTVNRIWEKLFGEGLVRTVDYFGTRGERPSHPQLLDWLATEFIRNGWSQKRLIREIVLSRAYRMSSKYHPEAAARDPDNRLLWRMNRRRLDAESLRDTLLSVSGALQSNLGGPALALQYIENVGGLNPKDVNPVSFRLNKYPDWQQHYRTIYLPVVRSAAQPGPAELRNLFDFPPPTEMAGQRPSTSVATQALFLMNSEFIKSNAQRLSEWVLKQPITDDRSRLELLYLRALNRPVTETELEIARKFLDIDTSDDKQRGAWTAYCHALLSSNEFLFRL